MNSERGGEPSGSESAVQQWLRSEFEVPTVCVPVASLLPADSPRLTGCKASHTKLLAASDAPLPPIIVHRETMRIIDGMHRLAAAMLTRCETIEVRFFDGSIGDAFVLAVRANVTHGLPLTLADRKAAATRIVESHPQWSDRLIGMSTGLSHKTVAVLRRCSSGEDSQLNVRLGLDGKVHPLTNSEGRLIAAELLQDDRKASLRQIAKTAGISVGTVRDVRDRIGRGEAPIPARGCRSEVPPSPPPSDEVCDIRPPAGHEGSRDGTDSVVADCLQHSAALSRLRKDPALRFNEKGRALIRLLSASLTGVTQCRTLAEEVPAHCLGTVVELAASNAHLWHQLARELDERSGREHVQGSAVRA